MASDSQEDPLSLKLEHAPTHDEADADIVAVQGLGSTYERTWTAKNEKGETCMWLRDLLAKDLPTARILTYRYDSEWFGNPSHVTLRDCGRRLLDCLIFDRTHRGRDRMCPSRRKRPLILIGHSFGGLVIKQALVLASQTSRESPQFEDCQHIIMATAGIVFLGTPHRGSNGAEWGLRKISVGRLFGKQAYEEQMKVLLVDSTTSLLSSLLEDFGSLSGQSLMKGLLLHCFYELKPMPIGIIVTKLSACLDNAPATSLDANHKEMNKFVRGDNYNRVFEVLRQMFIKASIVTSHRAASLTYSSKENDPALQHLRSWLGSSVEASLETQQRHLQRLQEIRDGETCRWISRNQQFSDWLDLNGPKTGLWVYGKPGTGKSVLASHVIDLLQVEVHVSNCSLALNEGACEYEKASRAHTAIYFFCGADAIAPPIIQILETLVHQVLKEHKQNRLLLQAAVGYSKDNRYPTKSLLLAMLKELTAILKGVHIVIDGFNEIPTKSWKELLSSLETLRTERLARMAFFGQPDALVTGTLLADLRLSNASIDIVNHSDSDISYYVTKKVSALCEKMPELRDMRDEPQSELLSRCEGMFQWVSLVIGTLESYQGSPKEVRTALKAFPEGLQAAYVTVIRRQMEKPSHIQNRIRLALRFLTVAQTLVTTEELVLAVSLMETVDEPQYSGNVDSLDAGEFLQILGSLVVVNTNQGRPIVRLCHSSLRLFLLSSRADLESYCQKTGQQEIESVLRYCVVESDAHRETALVCMRLAAYYAEDVTHRFYHINNHEPPMVSYSWRYWFDHFQQSGNFANDLDLINAMKYLLASSLKETMVLLGAISATLLQPVSLGVTSGGIEKTVGVHDAYESLTLAIKSTKSLYNMQPAPIFIQSASKQVAAFVHLRKYGPPRSKRPDIVARRFLRSLMIRVELRAYHQNISEFLASLEMVIERDAELLPVFQSMSKLAETSRALRSLACNLAVNPVRFELLSPTNDFSPTAPLLYACGIIDSVLATPFLPLLPNKDLTSLNAARTNREFDAANRAVADLSSRPTKSDEYRAKQDGKALHKLRASRVVLIQYCLALFRPATFATLIYDPLANTWLNNNVHIRIAASRRMVNPLHNFATHAVDHFEQPGLWSTLGALPETILLLLSKVLIDICRQMSIWAWPLLIWQRHRMIMTAQNIVNYTKMIHLTGWGYAVCGLGLYLLRYRYFPEFGAHWNAYPIRDFKLVARDPVQWILERSAWTWWDLARYYVVWGTGSLMFLGGSLMGPSSHPANHLVKIFLSMWSMTALERTFCMFINTTLTISAPIVVLINPKAAYEATTSETISTPFSWTTFFIRLVIILIVLGISAQQGTFLVVLKPMLSQVLNNSLLLLFVWILPTLMTFVFRPGKWQDPTTPFIIALFATFSVLYVVHFHLAFLEDPHGLKPAFKALQSSTETVSSVIGEPVQTLDQFTNLDQLTENATPGAKSDSVTAALQSPAIRSTVLTAESSMEAAQNTATINPQYQTTALEDDPDIRQRIVRAMSFE